MRDPHVEKLIYKLKENETVEYEDPSKVDAILSEYHLSLNDGILSIEMQIHCASVNEARQKVEPFLRAWETDTFLKSRHEQLYFEFKDSKVIDLDPPDPGETITLQPSSIVHSHSIEMAVATVTKNEYPQPPSYESLSPDAETLVERYRGYRDGKEQLLAMSYFCLTLIESRAKNRKEAAKKCFMDKDILDKIGELSSTRGYYDKARKHYSKPKKISSKEKTWLDSAIRQIILQVAEVDNGNKPNKLMMRELPNL